MLLVQFMTEISLASPFSTKRAGNQTSALFRIEVSDAASYVEGLQQPPIEIYLKYALKPPIN
jgi:hypothetical protein